MHLAESSAPVAKLCARRCQPNPDPAVMTTDAESTGTTLTSSSHADLMNSASTLLFLPTHVKRSVYSGLSSSADIRQRVVLQLWLWMSCYVMLHERSDLDRFFLKHSVGTGRAIVNTVMTLLIIKKC